MQDLRLHLLCRERRRNQPQKIEDKNHKNPSDIRPWGILQEVRRAEVRDRLPSSGDFKGQTKRHNRHRREKMRRLWLVHRNLPHRCNHSTSSRQDGKGLQLLPGLPETAMRGVLPEGGFEVSGYRRSRKGQLSEEIARFNRKKVNSLIFTNF